MEIVAFDQRAGNRAAAKAGKYHTEGSAHNAHNNRVFRAQRFIRRGNGSGSSNAAH